MNIKNNLMCENLYHIKCVFKYFFSCYKQVVNMYRTHNNMIINYFLKRKK